MKHIRLILLLLLSGPAVLVNAQDMLPYTTRLDLTSLIIGFILVIILLLLMMTMTFKKQVDSFISFYKKQHGSTPNTERFKTNVKNLTSKQITELIKFKNEVKKNKKLLLLCFIPIPISLPNIVAAQKAPVASQNATSNSIWEQGPVIITIILLLLVLLTTAIVLIIKVKWSINSKKNKLKQKEAIDLADYLKSVPDRSLRTIKNQKESLDYSLTHHELSGTLPTADKRGLLHIRPEAGLPIVSAKKKMCSDHTIDPALSKVIQWYFISATFWLLFGTTVGEYLGIKFVAPDVDSLSWLNFGRLRPVHTNAVFWGWSSLGMLGLGYYIVPRVSNGPLANIKWAWYALHCINLSITLGSITLMMGINNGGGEYREYIWPIMLIFGIGLALTLSNYFITVARRKTTEIYISNWYIVSALSFFTIVGLVGYLPQWQNGLGETIVQGYYMHQAVGMWFMLFTLGIVYYFLPQQLNKPIYSYSLGILAFWAQIVFYTLIGTHHFVFSAIPWWLQTVAIVASVGMVIPVIAGTTNFLMTFKGAWYKLRDSYTLPFFLVGIIFYFTGSMQGTAEAFRYANLIWHFTDFTVAHSHMTMYGIITFLLWAGIYSLIPQLTGREAPQLTIGIHFWLALIGLLLYSIPLMYGGSLRGLSWIAGEPFVDSVSLMLPYWLWRAIGGTLMWLSHLVFAFNMYKMIARPLPSLAIEQTAIDLLMKTDNKMHDN
ncbi:cytochrome oxidase subunit I [Sphingobacterium psychroaquaticum]|uniref:cbb3-type cytochrome c oxidase subunit I n=1 Tax=Sphingobacterium psychroaquaticum TaxID=561061 RepID=UPI00106BCB64|nr:cbb3-type cytochrome c oxidase subunit I [Sphingobacterium psychroaquaticum]QBQ40309.1 cytochrome oxidase subunit I [Sphingobacterium psychroaquaticum]